MIEKNHHIDPIIIDYLNGNIDQASFKTLKEWCMESDDNRHYIKEKFELWFLTGCEDAAERTKANSAFDRFCDRVSETKKTNHRSITIRWIEIAAAVILILLLPMAGYWLGGKHSYVNSDVTVKTALGSRSELTLPDGTKVWLNSGSQITYSSSFGVKNRQLALTGEGFFDVTHNEDLPFEIVNKDFTLKVVGTKFDFKNYPTDKTATVDLMRGKVYIENSDRSQQLYLTPSQRMTLDKNTGQMKKVKIDISDTSDWTQGEIFFDEEKLSDIATELERCYNIKIVVEPNVRDIRFYGNFNTANSSLDEILHMISITELVKYKYDNGKYILY
jgi:transmembrane sensor